ncbi:MAG: hypothetical protein J6T99_11040 [Oscillospiraceae bacterium]|nr:hypothetical protein [Oscillospiraceae bacterium]
MDFEKAKQIIKDAIDQGNTLIEIMEIAIDKIYEQGKEDQRKDDEP